MTEKIEKEGFCNPIFLTFSEFRHVYAALRSYRKAVAGLPDKFLNKEKILGEIDRAIEECIASNGVSEEEGKEKDLV